MKQIFELIISPTGVIQLETKGIPGFVCRKASRSLEKALGRLTDERLTSEYHLQPGTAICSTQVIK
jgi:hypothetical protein